MLVRQTLRYCGTINTGGILLATLTRRQRMVLDALLICHRKPSMHPSPRWLANHIEHWGEKAVRADIANLIALGLIEDVEVGTGSAPSKYKLHQCDCTYCTSRPS